MADDVVLISGERCLLRPEFDRQTRQIAQFLRQNNIGQGDIIALMMRNDFTYFTLAEAVRYVGASITPLNWHLTASEISYILKDCGAKMIIIHDDLLTEDMYEILTDIQILVEPAPDEVRAAYARPKELLGEVHGLNVQFNALLKAPSLSAASAAMAPVDDEIGPPLPAIFYTSGTTGQPKAVERRAIDPQIGKALAQRSAQAFGLTSQPMRALMTGPLYHSAPNAYALYALRNGGQIILQAKFDAREFLALVERHQITHTHMVPIMFQRLLALPPETRDEYDTGSLAFVVHGAAPCPSETKAQIIDLLGPVINEYYAMTELGIIATSSSQNWLDNPGTVGSPPPGVEIHIRDEEGGLCPAETAGVIWVRHEATHAFSYRNAAEKADAMRQDNFVNTGDIGYLNERGFLFISDRQTDMIISGGVNIYPAEIEAALASIAAIKDSAVFGVPDADYGERVIAFLETDEDLDQKLLHEMLASKIGKFKIPREFICVDRLPREDSGKIKKRHIRTAFLAGEAS